MSDVKIKDLSKTFYVRKLDKDDIELIYDLSCKNHIYYQYHPPFVTRESILDDMKALPPETSYDDKFYVGFFENLTYYFFDTYQNVVNSHG